MNDFDVLMADQLRASCPSSDYTLDCFVSSEVGYNEVLARCLPSGVPPRGAYLGVGPDQSYTYVGALRPDLAIVLDARLDNLLEHLIFKALFLAARDPLDYLCLLFGRARPKRRLEQSLPGRELVARFDRRPPDPNAPAREIVRRAFSERWHASPLLLDRVERIMSELVRRQLAVTSVSEGCLANLDKIPTFEEVITATTPSGLNLHYLTDLDRFAAVRGLHARNRIVPMLGNVTDPDSIARVRAMLNDEALDLSTIYLSNLEEFLLQRYVIAEDRVVARPNPDGCMHGDAGRAYARLVENLAALPCLDDAVLIRFFFPGEHRGRRLGVFPWLEPHVTFVRDFLRRFRVERPESVMATYV